MKLGEAAPGNVDMAWQSAADGKAKDKLEQTDRKWWLIAMNARLGLPAFPTGV